MPSFIIEEVLTVIGKESVDKAGVAQIAAAYGIDLIDDDPEKAAIAIITDKFGYACKIGNDGEKNTLILSDDRPFCHCLPLKFNLPEINCCVVLTLV